MFSSLAHRVSSSQRRHFTLLSLWFIAAASLYIGLLFPYFGEEGVYTASSYEMLFNHHFMNVYFMGGYYGRPPLYNWLILSVAHMIGYSHMLIAARFVTITLTIATSLLMYWFANTVTKNKTFSLFSIICFLSGDLLFRSSWIAYADPTFSFFTTASIFFMWVGCDRDQQRWLLLAIPALFAAFLTKTFTCYVFYGITALALLFQERRWRYFFHPISITLHLIALLLPYVWFLLLAKHHGGRMLWDLYHNFTQSSFSFTHNATQFLNKTLVYFLRFAPLSLIALYCLLSKKYIKPSNGLPSWVKTMAWCTLLNFLPYWLTPGVYQIRYLLPLFPFIAMLMAYIIYETNERILNFSILILAFFIAIKLLLSPWGLPWFEHMSYKYNRSAREIINATQSFPLYANYNDSVIATLDTLRYPKPPVIQPNTHQSNLFLVGNAIEPQDILMKAYHITNDHFTLYCRGLACQRKKKT